MYLRIECYRQQLFHLAEKLAVGVKWLPYTRRFTIWKHSRLNVQKRKIDTTRHIDYLYVEVEKEAEKMLHKLGIQEETLKKIVLKKYTFHLRGENYTRFDEKLKNSHLQLHERPPFLFTSNFELRDYLIPIGHHYGIDFAPFLEQDAGAQAGY